MTDFVLKGLFFQNARGVRFVDTGSLAWTFDPATNSISATASGSGGVDTANSPNANEFARFTDADTIEGRTAAEARADLSLVVGTNVQAWSANLDEYAGVNPTAAGLALLDDADAAAQRTTLALGNVDNTSDANKPVSTATQTALDLKANIASPTLTGTPAAPTAGNGTNTTQLATTQFVQTAVALVINSAPGALDTLDELAAALGDDANFASTVTAALAGKQPIDAGLSSIAALGATAGLVEKTATDTYTERLLGVGAGTSIPTRADADTRYAAASHGEHIATANSPNAGEWAKFTGASAIEGRTAAEAKADLDLEVGVDLQAFLVSATNIKTINGSTILGSGDLVVAGVAGDFDSLLTGSSTIAANKVRTIGGSLAIADGGGVLTIEDTGVLALV